MKKNINKKGFTLIELLAVIVILAVIMVFAIPAVLDTSNEAQKKALKMYAERVSSKALEKALSDQMLGEGTPATSATYSLVDDLKLSDTGNYSGCAKMTNTGTGIGDTAGFTITVYLTDGRFCTGNSGYVNGSSSFTVQDTGCPANYNTICAS